MDTQQTTAYRQQLEAMRTALLAQIAEQRGDVVSRIDVAADHFGHPDETGAQLASERELEWTMGARERTELAAIAAALERLKDGSYGECTNCGAHIAPARLQASPQAPRCIPCQEKLEK